MAKSISLSTDMEVLYLMNNSGSFSQAFSLTGNGVFITLVSGDVSVAAASSSFSNGSDEFSTAAIAQWQAVFHENTNNLLMIGNDDVEPSVTGDIKKYDLSGGNTYNLRLNSAQTKLLIRTSR